MRYKKYYSPWLHNVSRKIQFYNCLCRSIPTDITENLVFVFLSLSLLVLQRNAQENTIYSSWVRWPQVQLLQKKLIGRSYDHYFRYPLVYFSFSQINLDILLLKSIISFWYDIANIIINYHWIVIELLFRKYCRSKAIMLC